MDSCVETFQFLGMNAIFASPAMKVVLDKVRRIAPSPVGVLLQGESGVGKEVVARAIHCFSARRAKAWVDINCAALPDHLVESELFGYEKGAFSGADKSKQGMFDLAEGGTLFLDEVAELDPRMQVKLLKVLDTGEFFRLGGVRKVKVDVRIITASNRDLKQLTAEGRFRDDLYHRLAQLRLDVPPLRERGEDILALAERFRQEYGVRPHFSPAATSVLLRYTWPGNVRELRNAVAGLLGACWRDEILVEDLPSEIRQAAGDRPCLPADLLALARQTGDSIHTTVPEGGLLENAERALVLMVLRNTAGRQEEAARILGISSRTLRRKLRDWESSAAFPVDSHNGGIP